MRRKKEEAQGYYNTMAEYETNATRLSSEKCGRMEKDRNKYSYS